MDNRYIFVIHKGNHEYFKACISSIKNSNPDAHIVLFGDERNADIVGVEHIDYDDAKKNMILKFDEYVHLSPNSEEYERICLDRFFVIYDYMKKNQIDIGFHMDSDVLLNVKLEDKYYNGKFNYCRNCGGTMIFTLAQIEKFCLLIKEWYTSSQKLQQLKDLYNLRIERGMAGGISDMTFFNLYVMNYTDDTNDMSRIRYNECFDYFFGNPEGYERYMGKCRIYCKNGTYYYRHMLTGEFVQVNSLHCGAKDKAYMVELNRRPVGDSLMVFDYNKMQWVDGCCELTEDKNAAKRLKIREIKFHIRKKIESIIALRKR